MGGDVESVTDVLIVGGGPAGMMAGITAAQSWPGKRVLLVRPEADAVVPCGIPYIFGTLGGTDEDLAGRAPFLSAGGRLVVDHVVAIDRADRSAVLGRTGRVRWERLVLATGSEPVLPPIPGRELSGVFTIHKNYEYLDRLLSVDLPAVKTLAVVGGGFIGVEFAEEVRKRGIEVRLIEQQPHPLANSFDPEVSRQVEAVLGQVGVKLHTGTGIAAFEAGDGGDRVGGVRLSDGTLVPCDAALVAIGARPNTRLAEDMGLTLSRSGGVWVDGFQRSREDPAIFAVGDCAHKQDFFTRHASHAMLASQAAAEGRIAGMNLYGLRLLRANAGTIAVYASRIADLAFGVAGLTEATARALGFSVAAGSVRLPDHHPATMPGTREIHCRLLFDRVSERLLGGQVTGGATTAELLNTIAIAIQLRATATDIASLQFGSHPRLTAPVHPVVAATGDALVRWGGAGSDAPGSSPPRVADG